MSDIILAAERDGWEGLRHCRKCGTGILVDTDADGPAPIVECGRCAKAPHAVIIRTRGRQRQHHPETHVVYRFWDRSGRLLYVGVSSRIEHRFSQHRREKPWDLVQKITLAHYDTREEADRAELTAIHNERPLWNIKGNE